MTSPRTDRGDLRVPRGARCPNCGDALGPGVLRCPRDGALINDHFDPLVGATLAGRFRLIARLGRGGMSSVYLARHTVIDRLGAVKVLRQDLSGDPVHRDRFLREARAVNRIQHENIVDITDYGETSDGVVFLVMEYLPGDSLLSVIARGPLSLRRALDIARQIASGLGRAHQASVIHRDLKPDNVVLIPRDDRGELVKVLDFGIAKLLDQPALTLNHKVFGTPGYIAPEYATGGAITPRTDLYSLGVVLYEMVTGALPFDVEHVGELLVKHVLEPPVPPRKRVASLPPPVDALILRCLAKDPNERHRDAYHFIEDIDRLARDLRGDPLADAVLGPPRPSIVLGGSRGIHVEGLGDREAEESPTTLRPVLRSIHEEETERGPARVEAPAVKEEPTPVDGLPVHGGVLDLPSPSRMSTPLLPAAWREFLSALLGRLGERYWGSLPPAVGACVERMEALVAELAERAVGADITSARILGLEVRGREFRSTIGQAMDALAADLSLRQRRRDEASARRDELGRRREEALAGVLHGDPDAQGEADARLWELAACEELLRDEVRACEDVEYQLGHLGQQLEEMNVALESEQLGLQREVEAGVGAILEVDASLRREVELLDALTSTAVKH